MERTRFVTVAACSCGAAFAHRETVCPECGRSLTAARVRGHGKLLSETTVRVNPTGAPFRLGVVKLPGDVRALCIVLGETRGSGYDNVRVITADGRFYAIGAGVNGRSPRRRASDADSQSS